MPQQIFWLKSTFFFHLVKSHDFVKKKKSISFNIRICMCFFVRSCFTVLFTYFFKKGTRILLKNKNIIVIFHLPLCRSKSKMRQNTIYRHKRIIAPNQSVSFKNGLGFCSLCMQYLILVLCKMYHTVLKNKLFTKINVCENNNRLQFQVFNFHYYNF